MIEFHIELPEAQSLRLGTWVEQHFKRRMQQKSTRARKQKAGNKAADRKRRHEDKDAHPDARYLDPANKILIPDNELSAGVLIAQQPKEKKKRAPAKTHQEKQKLYDEEQSKEQRARKLWKCCNCGRIFAKGSAKTHPESCKYREIEGTAPVTLPPAPTAPPAAPAL